MTYSDKSSVNENIERYKKDLRNENVKTKNHSFQWSLAIKTYFLTLSVVGILSYFQGCGIGFHVGYQGEEFSFDAAWFGVFLASFTIAPIVTLLAVLVTPKKESQASNEVP